MRHCAELAELLSAYADGQTVPAQTELLETHLASCRACIDALHRLRETATLLRYCDDDWSPPDLRLRVAHAYRGKQSGSPHISVLAVLAMVVASVAIAFQVGPGLRVASPDITSVTPSATSGTHATCAPCLPARPTPSLNGRGTRTQPGSDVLTNNISQRPVAPASIIDQPIALAGRPGDPSPRHIIHLRGTAPVPV